jgi:hypothetical protein
VPTGGDCIEAASVKISVSQHRSPAGHGPDGSRTLGACFLKHLHQRAAIFERSRIGIGAAAIA